MKRMKATTKRKLAGIVAVVLIIAMVLSAILPIFMRTASAEEAQQFTIEAQVGFNGAVKVESYAPIKIRVTNNSGKNFNGRVCVRTNNTNINPNSYNVHNFSDEGSAEFYSEMELAAGDTKEVSGYMPVLTINSNCKVQMINNKEKVVAEGSTPVYTSSREEMWVAVLSDSDRAGNIISRNFTELSSAYGLSRAVTIDESDLNCIDNFNMIVISDYDFNKLQSTSIANLEKWVSDGGYLFVGGKSNNAEDYSWLNIQPSQSYSGDQQTDYKTNSLIKAINEYSAYTLELESIVGALDDEHKQMLYLYFMLATNEGYGYELDFDTVESDLYSAASDYLYNQANIQTVYNAIEQAAMKCFTIDVPENVMAKYLPSVTDTDNSYDVSTGYYVGDGYIEIFPATQLEQVICKFNGRYYTSLNDVLTDSDFNANLTRPKDILGTVFLGIIMLYSIAIGPLLYSILKKKDKKEMAIKYIPVSAVTLSCIIILCSFGSRFQRPIASVLTVINAEQGGTAPLTGAIACATPAKGDINIENDKILDSHYYQKSYYDAKDYRATFSGFNYTMLNQTKWDKNDFVFNDSVDLTGGLELKIKSYSDDKIEGTVTNNTGYDLKNVAVIHTRNEVAFIGDMDNGQSVEFSESWKFQYSSGIYKKLTGNQYAFLQNINEFVVQDGRICVVGFDGDTDFVGNFRLNGRKAVRDNTNAFYSVSERYYDNVEDFPAYNTYSITPKQAEGGIQ